jgi:hypothetical protein
LSESTGPKKTIWNCRCDCGKTKTIAAQNLRNGDSRSCGCLRKEMNALPLGHAAFNALFSKYKRGSQNRALEWNLNKEDFRKLTTSNCYWCNTGPTKVFSSRRANGSYVYNGLDRLYNDVGYSTKNCVACCEKCNRAKLTMTPEEFSEWIARFETSVSRIFALGRLAYE